MQLNIALLFYHSPLIDKRNHYRKNDCIYIDIFEIWETYCAAADLILNIKIFKNDKLSNELEKQLNYIIHQRINYSYLPC